MQAPSCGRLRAGPACSPARRGPAVPQAIFKQKTGSSKPKAAKAPPPKRVQYGNDWYASTRSARQFRTVREEMEYRREANQIANNGRERKDLYTDNWDGSEYKGSKFNILTVIGIASILAPLAGLVFAYQTYGVLWG